MAIRALSAIAPSKEMPARKPLAAREWVVGTHLRDDGTGYFEVQDQSSGHVTYVETSNVFREILTRMIGHPQFDEMWRARQSWRWRNNMWPR